MLAQEDKAHQWQSHVSCCLQGSGSDLNRPQNHPEGLFNHRGLGLHPEHLLQQSSGGAWALVFLLPRAAAGLKPPFENQFMGLGRLCVH